MQLSFRPPNFFYSVRPSVWFVAAALLYFIGELLFFSWLGQPAERMQTREFRLNRANLDTMYEKVAAKSRGQ